MKNNNSNNAYVNEVVELAQKLVRCKSVTPADDNVLEILKEYFEKIGFDVEILEFCSNDNQNKVKNLFAKYGLSENKILGFLGHADVVPAGDEWVTDPFSGNIVDDHLIARGIADMKGGVAAFCVAAKNFIQQNNSNFDGSIHVMITCDEEIGTYEGAQALIKWCKDNKRLPHVALIGEPSSHKQLGDRIYVGHRGSFNVKVFSKGIQGHVAYTGNYKNSLTPVCAFITHMSNYRFHYNDERFLRTHIEPTMFFTNNYATNVVPEYSCANLNIRFSNDYNITSIKELLIKEAKNFDVEMEFSPSGNAYYCNNKVLHNMMIEAIQKNTGIKAELSAAGGTSDGRFLIAHCDVIEFGLLDETIHQKNERTHIKDLAMLELIYRDFIYTYFKKTI